MKLRYAHFFRIVLAIIVITACSERYPQYSNTFDANVIELNTFNPSVKSEDLLLGMPVRLKYDSDNQRLFIQDLPKWAVIEIDDSSNVINEYGNRGRGPGEIQMLNDFFFNKKHLYIVDGGQYLIHKFNRDDGKYISSLNYGESSEIIPPSPPIPLNDNNNQVFVTLNETVLIPSQFGGEYLFMAVNWQGEKIADIAEMPENCTISEDEETAKLALKKNKVPAKDQCLAFPVNDHSNTDEIFIIYSAIPKIVKYNLSGQKLWERKIPNTPEVDSLAIDLSNVVKEHPDRQPDTMPVRKYIAGRSNKEGELFLITYTNLVTRYTPRRSVWVHKFDKNGNLLKRMKIVSEEDLNPYVGIDFEEKKIITNPFMQVDIREYTF